MTGERPLGVALSKEQFYVSASRASKQVVVYTSEKDSHKFGSEEVKIVGRNSNAQVRQGVRLFAGITRHRVPWIQEVDLAAALAAGKGAVVVDAIK